MESVEISMDGFKVVSIDYFCAPARLPVPSFTIWYGSIGFSKQDLLLLNSCENVVLQINSKKHQILVVPSTSKDKNAVKWIKSIEPLESRKLKCKKLTDSLYEEWGWDRDYNYRTSGKLVTSGNKVMLLFDFSDPESWKRPEAKTI